MIVASYTRELGYIKTELSRYSHHSVFNCAMNYLDQGRTLKHMPWVVMFSLKLSLLEVSGSLEMSNDAFLKLINRIYKLSNRLLDTSPEIFMLMMRAMVIQQLWYQVPIIDSWRQVILQRTLLERSRDFNNDLFHQKVGITLNEYYKIACYLMTVTGKENPNSVVRWSMTAFYSHLSPAISDAALVNFLKLVALPFQRLPQYLQPFITDCP